MIWWSHASREERLRNAVSRIDNSQIYNQKHEYMSVTNQIQATDVFNFQSTICGDKNGAFNTIFPYWKSHNIRSKFNLIFVSHTNIERQIFECNSRLIQHRSYDRSNNQPHFVLFHYLKASNWLQRLSYLKF